MSHISCQCLVTNYANLSRLLNYLHIALAESVILVADSKIVGNQSVIILEFFWIDFFDNIEAKQFGGRCYQEMTSVEVNCDCIGDQLRAEFYDASFDAVVA